MDLKQALRAAVASALFLNVGAALAASTGTTQMQSRMWEDASAEVTVKDSGADTKEITVDAENLVPDSVFTVWFVSKDGGASEGVGEGKNSFRTDGEGDGTFTATVPEGEIEDWDWLVVGYHPEGDPGNTENLHVALTAELNEFG